MSRSLKNSPFQLMDFLGTLTRQSIPTPEVMEALLKLNEAINKRKPQSDKIPSQTMTQTTAHEFQTESIARLNTMPKESSYTCKRPPGVTNQILREKDPQ